MEDADEGTVTDERPDVRVSTEGQRWWPCTRERMWRQASRQAASPSTLSKTLGPSQPQLAASGATRAGWACVLGQQPGGLGRSDGTAKATDPSPERS